jgi:arylsulfatase
MFDCTIKDRPPGIPNVLRKTTAGWNKRSHAALLGATTLLSLSLSGPAAAQQQQKPNILFIMGGDIGWMQLVSYQQGLGIGETPNLERIANEGARFMGYYAEQSCTALLHRHESPAYRHDPA